MPNIYLTPAFLEDNLAQGIKPDTLADFIAASVPDFKEQLMNIKQRSGNDPRAIEAFLTYKAYGTTKPAQRATPMLGPSQQGAPVPNTPQDRGILGSISDAINAPGDLATGVINQGLDAVGLDIAGQTEEAQNVGVNANKVVENFDMYGGAVGSAFGPLGAGAGTAVGSGLTNMVREIQGERDPNNIVADIAGPVAKGALAAGTQAAVTAAPAAIKNFVGNRQTNHVQKLVQPKATEKVIQQASLEGRVQKGGLLRSGKITPSAQEAKIAESAMQVGAKGKDIIKNQQVVTQGIDDIAGKVEQRLTANNAIFNGKELASALKSTKAADLEAFGNEKTAETAYQGILNIWNTTKASHKSNLSGLWKARKAFDKELERQFGKRVFDPINEAPRHAAVRSIRQTVNDFIEQKATKAGTSFLPEIREMSNLYQALENMATKVGKDTLKSGLHKAVTSRTGKIVTGAALGGAATTLGIRSLPD
jgi:hypothetical protein